MKRYKLKVKVTIIQEGWVEVNAANSTEAKRLAKEAIHVNTLPTRGYPEEDQFPDWEFPSADVIVTAKNYAEHTSK